MDKLSWVESSAIENMRLHHHTADILAKEAQTTLTVLLAGMGGSVAYSARVFASDGADWLSYGAAAFTLYLLVLNWALVVFCLKIAPIPQIFNEPKNLWSNLYTLDELRVFELENLQDGIDAAAERNGKLAKRLNRIRLFAVFSPICFALAWLVNWLVLAWPALMARVC